MCDATPSSIPAAIKCKLCDENPDGERIVYTCMCHICDIYVCVYTFFVFQLQDSESCWQARWRLLGCLVGVCCILGMCFKMCALVYEVYMVM